MADGAAIAPPITLDALTLRDRLASGALSAVDLAEVVIARIESREPTVRAWAWFDPDFLRQQAAGLDAHRKSGRPIGPLHGLPVGIKDIIDTKGIPTENGTVIDKGRVPKKDATLVSRLRAAGAMIVGKTATTPLATFEPSNTTNPRNVDHTPGGSSAGSAAAVADGMIPLAIGTQTSGSVIRPASYCGVTGFKPSFGIIPRTGILTQSPTLDTVGVFAADPSGAALLVDALAGYDDGDPATSPVPAPNILKTSREHAPVPPQFAFVKLPGWNDASQEITAAFEELTSALGEQVFGVDLTEALAYANEARAQINFAEMAHHYQRFDASALPQMVLGLIESGQAVTATEYLNALDAQRKIKSAFDEIFARADAILCPAALGPAPKGLSNTGDPKFNGLWTMAGLPAVTLPILSSDDGMPMGVQLVGPRGWDGRLLRTANWLYQWVDTEGETV